MEKINKEADELFGSRIVDLAIKRLNEVFGKKLKSIKTFDDAWAYFGKRSTRSRSYTAATWMLGKYIAEIIKEDPTFSDVHPELCERYKITAA
jgi:hypothetical protein